MSKGKVNPVLTKLGNNFNVSKRPEIIVGSRQKEEFPGLVEALNDMDFDASISWEVETELVTPLKLKLQRWLRGKNINETFAVLTDGDFVYIVRK